MIFQTGEWVVHCKHGLGQVQGIEQRAMNGSDGMYYVVQTSDLTIWVPQDEHIESRLRAPNSASAFKAILTIFTQPADTLPADFRQRNLQLQTLLKDGTAEAWCKLLRDLSAFRQDRPWSDYDRTLSSAVRKVLLGEWSFSLSITPEQAEKDLRLALPAR